MLVVRVIVDTWTNHPFSNSYADYSSYRIIRGLLSFSCSEVAWKNLSRWRSLMNVLPCVRPVRVSHIVRFGSARLVHASYFYLLVYARSYGLGKPSYQIVPRRLV